MEDSTSPPSLSQDAEASKTSAIAKPGPFAVPFGLPAEIIQASYQVASVAEIDAEIEERECGLVERRLLCYTKLRANWAGKEWALIPGEARTALARYLGMDWKNVKPILDRLVFDHIVKVDEPADGRLFLKIEPPQSWTRPRRRSIEEGTAWLGEAVSAPDLASQPLLGLPIVMTPEKKVSPLNIQTQPVEGGTEEAALFALTPKKKVSIAIAVQPQLESFQSCESYAGQDWRALKARLLALTAPRANWTKPMRDELWPMVEVVFGGDFSAGGGDYTRYWRKAVHRVPDVVAEVIILLVGEKMDSTITHRRTNAIAYAEMVKRGFDKIP